MTENQKKLLNILREMFQFDQADLDFGIYRIMRMKRDEVNRFIEEELPAQISAGLNELAALDTTSSIAEIDRQIAETKSGSLPEAIKATAIAAYEEQKKSLAGSVDITAVEADVYNHLTNFFSRYYDDGDFISQRRYKDGAYAIPYEGEEVKLHWANADQYYVKTSEYFKDYTFKTMYGETVRFKLIEAETERDNNKASEKRYFQIRADKPFEVIDGELFVYVEYKASEYSGKTAQAKHILEIVEAFIAVQSQPEYRPFSAILAISDGKTLLERQLNRYTARNTFDYFIHKDLGKFLRRELDFYIKNDVIYLDDIEEQDEAKTKEYLTKAKVIRKIARKIITFLAQIEDFQKKLYLKKKFVVEANYCITLDRVPEAMYAEIAANDAQREEWVRLFAIDEIESTDGDLVNAGTLAYSVPLTVEFLKQNPFLVLDTAFFSAEFKELLIGNINGLDEELDGLIIHSDNYQALSLLHAKHSGRINCIHIDPPYNTDTSGFLYKNNYQHSSWLSMMHDRLQLSQCLMDNKAVLACHIDENEYERLYLLLSNMDFKNLGTISWDKRNAMTGGKGIATQHEYITLSSNSNDVVVNIDSKIFIEILDKVKSLIAANGGRVDNNVRKKYATWLKTIKERYGGEVPYKYIDDDGAPYQSVSLRAPEKRTDPKFFIPLIHPVTGKPCPVPPNGFSRTPETLQSMIDTGDILFGVDEKVQPRQKSRLTPETEKQMTSVIQNGNKGKSDVDALGLAFPYCHPVSLYENIIGSLIKGNLNGVVLDYFAGSGTSAHALININRENQTHNKYILIEMGEYIDQITKPRIEKVVYSRDWKKGKPVSRKGSSHAFKYLRLESYEDTLNNIVLSGGNYDMLGAVREGYMLSYMLSTESVGSASLLNVEKLDKPFSYKMNIIRNLESAERNIDLVETFNYLIGLTVVKSHALVSYDADFPRGEYGVVSATLKDGDTYKFKAVEGTVPSGEKTLVIWREMTGDIEKDNAALDAYFLSIPNARSFKRIYVNCDNNLLNLRGNGESWQVNLIDEEMKTRMFEDAE